MSSVKSVSSKQPTRQYISTVPFNNDFFSYTVTRNRQAHMDVGTLTAPIAGATIVSCPAGRILRENGKKLYPDVHPSIDTFMVGVIDSITLLSGFIDPNSPVFAPYSNELPVFYDNGVDPGVQGLNDQGAPVYTNGIVSAKGAIISNGQIRSVGAAGQRVAINGTQPNIAIDVSQGSFVFISGNGNNTLTCSNFNLGDRLFIQLVGTGNVTFSTGFGISTATNGSAKDSKMISFICDGAHMLQQSDSSWFNVY
jgi:hypothetical protein